MTQYTSTKERTAKNVVQELRKGEDKGPAEDPQPPKNSENVLVSPKKECMDDKGVHGGVSHGTVWDRADTPSKTGGIWCRMIL